MGSGVDSRLTGPRVWVGFLTGTLLAGFWFFLREPVRMALPENDLWWMIPTFQTLVRQRSGLDQLAFLFSPWPIRLGQPLLKVMFFLLQKAGHDQLSTLAVVLAAVHLLNAFLLFRLALAFGLRRRIAWMAGLIAACFFPQFHSYLWPVALQHLSAVTFLLAILCLWLKGESLGARDPRKRFYGWITLGLTLAGSLGRGLLLLPLLLLGDLWLNSESASSRRRRFERVWPLLAVFLIYPLGAIVWVGDDRLTTVLSEVGFAPWVRYTAALAAGLGALFLLGWIFRWCEQARWERRLSIALGVGAAAVAGLLFRWDHRQILLPYNLLVPLTTCLGAFLEPFSCALRIDDAEILYGIPPAVSPFLLILSVVWIGGLLRASKGNERRVVRFCLLWYLLAVLYPTFQYATYPVRIPSRYFVYLSPPFSLIFSLAVARLLGWLEGRLGWRRALHRRAAEAAVALLCLANLAAIRVAVWKGRWANNYAYYDDLRTVQLIREDRLRKNSGDQAGGGPVRISGIEPMPYKVRFWRFVPSDPQEYQLFKLLARQESVGLGAGAQVEVSGAGKDSGADYRVEGVRVLRRDGSVVGRFDASWEEGVSYFQNGDLEKARDRLETAVREQPFLLKFLLPEGERQETVQRLTGPHRGIRRWLEHVREHRESPTDPALKLDRVREVVDGELSRYLVGLFLLAYLEDRGGREEASRFWFRQTQWLEPDTQLLQEWIRKAVPVRWNASLEKFLMGL